MRNINDINPIPLSLPSPRWAKNLPKAEEGRSRSCPAGVPGGGPKPDPKQRAPGEAQRSPNGSQMEPKCLPKDDKILKKEVPEWIRNGAENGAGNETQNNWFLMVKTMIRSKLSPPDAYPSFVKRSKSTSKESQYGPQNGAECPPGPLLGRLFVSQKRVLTRSRK